MMMDTNWFEYAGPPRRRRYIIVIDRSDGMVRYRYPSERVVREMPRLQFITTFSNNSHRRNCVECDEPIRAGQLVEYDEMYCIRHVRCTPSTNTGR